MWSYDIVRGLDQPSSTGIGLFGRPRSRRDEPACVHRWLGDYLEGTGKEIYRVQLSAAFQDMRFEDVRVAYLSRTLWQIRHSVFVIRTQDLILSYFDYAYSCTRDCMRRLVLPGLWARARHAV